MNEGTGGEMAGFWDQRARENPLWFINSALDFDHPDEAAFWASGEQALEDSLALFDLRLDPSQVVLEIGCGIGRITRALASRAARVVAIDVSPGMIAGAREALAGIDNIELLVGNGVDLAGCPDATADVVYSFVTFQHIPDPEVTCGYLRDMGRVLRPGGWALFQASDDPALHRPERWAGQAPTANGPPTCLHPSWLGSALPRERLEQALADGGMTVSRRVGEGTLFCFTLAQKTV
ncbi:MAG: class I SAM-dependent methyltransferase [Candidatus Dormibacteria bacterium]